MEVRFKQGMGSKKVSCMSDKVVSPVKRSTKICGELGNGILFLLTPEWLKEWEKDDEAEKQVALEDSSGQMAGLRSIRGFSSGRGYKDVRYSLTEETSGDIR